MEAARAAGFRAFPPVPAERGGHGVAAGLAVAELQRGAGLSVALSSRRAEW